MRQSYAFLLTVLPDEESKYELRGRVRMIATGTELTFTSMEQLAEILRHNACEPQLPMCDGEPDPHSS